MTFGHAAEMENNGELILTRDFPLPVKSILKPGKVAARTLPANSFSHPFFIVGDDVLSRKWLQKNAARLQALHAIGFITNVADKKTLDEITRLAGLPLQAMDIDELAKVIGARHYPLAVESGAIWQ